MELQEKMPAFEALGIRVLALSYDEPDALKDFQDAYGITFTLLSDPDSRVIRGYGILNTLIAEDDHPWFGIPFPGTYVTDSQGDMQMQPKLSLRCFWKVDSWPWEFCDILCVR